MISSKKTIRFSFSCWFIYSLHLLIEFSDFCKLFWLCWKPKHLFTEIVSILAKTHKIRSSCTFFRTKKNILKVVERENAWHLLSFWLFVFLSCLKQSETSNCEAKFNSFIFCRKFDFLLIGKKSKSANLDFPDFLRFCFPYQLLSCIHKF